MAKVSYKVDTDTITPTCSSIVPRAVVLCFYDKCHYLVNVSTYAFRLGV